MDKQRDFRVGFGNDDHAIVLRTKANEHNEVFRKMKAGEVTEQEAKTILKVDKVKEIPIKPIIISGVRVDLEEKYTVKANSDGDVVYHAVMNAILLGTGNRDIGYHFPDTGTSEWTNVDSAKMVAIVMSKIKEHGWSVNNATVMVTAGAPRLKSYIEEMRTNLAKVLEIDLQTNQSRIGIGATTGEDLSQVARKEGIHADAVVSLFRE